MKIPRFIKNLQFIVKPAYWIPNNKFSKEWDIELNNLLDQYKFTNIKEHHAQLGPAILWIANVPYATMHIENYYHKYSRVRPARLTIVRCLERLKEDVKTKQEIRDDKLKKLLK